MLKRSSKAQHTLVELKAEVDDLAIIRDMLVYIRAEKIGVFHQIDTYYSVPKGRLKLREVEGKTDAELIYYERENVVEPKKSYVFILSIAEPKTFKRILERIMTVKATVDKIREIYFYKGIQIHLDKVEGLGAFIEFERTTSEDPKRQRKDLQKLEKLRKAFKISPESLERFSYSDLI